MWAHDLYGGPPPTQPNPAAAALGAPAPEAATPARTPDRQRIPGILANPTLGLVALLGLAALLINFTIRFEVTG